MSHPERRTRSVLRITTLTLAGAVVLAGAPAAISFAAGAAPTAPVRTAVTAEAPAAPARLDEAPVVAAPAAPRATAVRGWSGTARSVRAGRTLHLVVSVDGGRRDVRLEQRAGHRWRVVDRVRTAAHGRAAFDWTAPQHAGSVRLRVQAPATDGFDARTTAPRTVRVRPVPAPAPSAAAASPAAPSPVPSSAPPVVAPSPGTPSPATGAAAAPAGLQQQVLALVNQARATGRSCGGTAYPAAPALTEDAALDGAAGAFATRMATEGFFDHTAPDGSTMVTRLAAAGVRATAERENIAAGQTTPAAVMAAWLASPGHCADLMARDVTRIGIGHAVGGPYGVYWVQDFAG